MKKIIRVLFFAFALVLFTGTVNAAELKVNYVDERTNNTSSETITDFSKKYYKYEFLGLTKASDNNLYVTEDGKDYVYTFDGWYTSEGVKVGTSLKTATVVDGVKVFSFQEISSLKFNTSKDKEITLYAKWLDKIYIPNYEYHIYDNKAYAKNSVYTKSSKLYFNSTSSIVIDLHSTFLNDNATSYLRYNDKDEMVDLNKNASYYKFVKYVDENGNEITDGYTNNFIESVKFSKERVTSSHTYTNSLQISLKSAKTLNVTEDFVFNVYVIWEEHTDAILEHEYIDEVSTGSGSWKNVTGGTTSYTHTFTNPEDPETGTPMTHYDFLYWQHEEINDNQVNATKEYKAGDSFTYDLSNKPDKWTGKVTTYAWWQPDVTLNLYSDGKLLSSESSFTSVSATEPTKYGYKFLGWYDKDGNKVTETTFKAAEKGINPEVREYTLYAKWERIMTDVKVSLVWDDNNNEDGVRPTSVKVELKAGEEVVETITLSEENNWTYTFNVPKYSEESEIEYTVSQEEVEYYVTTTSGNVEEGFVFNNFHEVWPKGQGGDDFEVVQTGNEVNYSLLLIGLFIELLFVKRKLFN